MPTLETVQPPEINFSPLLQRYTLEEFWELPEPEARAHYDLIGGFLFKVPPPDPPHGDIGAFMTISLSTYLAAHGKPGKIYHPREAVWTDSTYLEPDMIYVSGTATNEYTPGNLLES